MARRAPHLSSLERAVNKIRTAARTERDVEDTPVLIVMHDSRQKAEAAGPPDASALEVLRAARDVHRAETALTAAGNAAERGPVGSSLEQAQEALKATLARIGGSHGGPS